jgi:hypothetical protein
MSLELNTLSRSSYKVCYKELDEACAFHLSEVLENLEPLTLELFSLEEPYTCTFYLLSQGEKLGELLGVNPRIGERFRVVYETKSIYFYLDRIREANLAEMAALELGHLIFNDFVGEHQQSIRAWRSPSWLREGYALQLSYMARPDSYVWLKKAWDSVVEAFKLEEWVPLSVLEKEITLIPNADRRLLAMHQAYFMVRLLIATLGPGFFKSYSQAMKESEKALASEVFNGCANMDYEKFLGMFKICVENGIEL